MDYDTPSFLFLQILFIGCRGVIETFLLHGLLTDLALRPLANILSDQRL